ADINHNRPQPAKKRHLDPVGGKPGKCPDKAFLDQITDDLAVGEETLAQSFDPFAIARRQFCKRARLTAPDVGYQFVVWSNGPTPHAQLRDCQHTYSLIRGQFIAVASTYKFGAGGKPARSKSEGVSRSNTTPGSSTST